MDGKLKIGVIVGIAFVAGIIGTLSFTSFDSQTETVESQSNPTNENLNIGAYVTVKAYHEDGTLYHEYEGHNDLIPRGKTTLVGCITGLISTPSRCNFIADDLYVQVQNQSDSSTTSFVIPGEITPSGFSCSNNPILNNDQCDSWEILGTFDFADLPNCTKGNDCVFAKILRSGNGTNGDNIVNFNEFTNFGAPVIGKNDRLFVNMTFTIPT